MNTPAAELLDAFQLAAGLPAWAADMCATAEQEIAAGQLGEACREWVTSAFGLTRLLLAMALRDRDAGPASTAVTALLLIFIRTMIRTVRQPGWDSGVLNHPFIAPPSSPVLPRPLKWRQRTRLPFRGKPAAD